MPTLNVNLQPIMPTLNVNLQPIASSQQQAAVAAQQQELQEQIRRHIDLSTTTTAAVAAAAMTVASAAHRPRQHHPRHIYHHQQQQLQQQQQQLAVGEGYFSRLNVVFDPKDLYLVSGAFDDDALMTVKQSDVGRGCGCDGGGVGDNSSFGSFGVAVVPAPPSAIASWQTTVAAAAGATARSAAPCPFRPLLPFPR